jgi:hypothetical protein
MPRFPTERQRRGGQEGLVITSGQVQKATAGSLDGTSKTVKKPVPLDEKPGRGQPQQAFLLPPSTLRIRQVVATSRCSLVMRWDVAHAGRPARKATYSATVSPDVGLRLG